MCVALASLRFFPKFFSRQKHRARRRLRAARVRCACVLACAKNSCGLQKPAIFPSEIAFLKFVMLRAPVRAVVRRAARANLQREGNSRDAAVFVLNMRKFACTFPGNAYHDRMKRVNPRRVKMITGD
jgi:hypothetical protein